MIGATHKATELRLAELLATLALVTDLARGRPSEEALRACLVATRLAQAVGLRPDETSDVYYMTLLRFVGCTAPSHEYTAALGGDQVTGRGRGDMSDMTKPREALAFLASFSSSLPAWRRPGAFVAALARAPKASREGIRADCEVAVRMAHRFQLAEPVAKSLYQSFERWDGHGPPQGLAGEAIALPARLAAVAFAAVMYLQVGGRQAAVDVVRRWRGGSLDPALADAFLERPGELLEGLEGGDSLPMVLGAEPLPHRNVSGGGIDEVAHGFADFVDLKSPYLHGHSSGVARVAEAAARAGHLPEDEVITLRRAGLLHDLGRAGVPTAIWEKRGPDQRGMGADPASPLSHRANPRPSGGARTARAAGRDAP